VIEVGGPGSLAKSIGAIRYCGHVSVIGNLAGKSTIDPATLFAKRASMCGIQVGSRDMFEAMNRALEVAKPVENLGVIGMRGQVVERRDFRADRHVFAEQLD